VFVYALLAEPDAIPAPNIPDQESLASAFDQSMVL
jgi:hypothetical protein